MSDMNDPKWTDRNRPFQICPSEDSAVNLHHDGTIHFTDFDGGGEVVMTEPFEELKLVYSILNRVFRDEE